MSGGVNVLSPTNLSASEDVVCSVNTLGTWCDLFENVKLPVCQNSLW